MKIRIKLKRKKPVSRQISWANKNKEAGLCVICAEPAVNASHCETHRDMAREWRKNAYKKLKDENTVNV
jgi:hypothetical protein